MTYRNGPIDERTILSNVVIKMHFGVKLSIWKSESQYKEVSEEIVNEICQLQHNNKICTSISSTTSHKFNSNKQNYGC